MSATDQLPKDFFKQFKSKEEFHSFFNDLFKQGVEEMLKAELEDYLGYEKYSKLGYGTGNSRNGSYPKTVKTDSLGDMVLNIPRDRNSEFEPQLIPKGERMSDKLEEAVTGMYSRGMSCSDIRSQIKEIYGVSVSETTAIEHHQPPFGAYPPVAGPAPGTGIPYPVDGWHTGQG